MNISSFLIYLLKCLPIILTALISDNILQNGPPKFLEKKTFMRFSIALFDNLAHSLIGLFLWLNVIDYKFNNKKNILGLVACFLTGSLIDIDHFIMAQSFMLEVLIVYIYINFCFLSICYSICSIYIYIYFIRCSK